MKTVFITGASSGIGRQTAKLFQSKGWNVIATMRHPGQETELNALDHVAVLPCDVTDGASIQNAVEQGIKIFGSIDVLVNNAGYYTLGALETFSAEQVRQQINTNLLGVIDMTREILPYFRRQRSGVIVNLSSIAGVISVPLQSLYHATKWGIEGFSESLQYELSPFHIRVKIIEPGVIRTDFFSRSMVAPTHGQIGDYEEYTRKVTANILGNGQNGSDPSGVAETIYKAATDHKNRLRYPTGNSKNFAALRALLPARLFIELTKLTMEQ